MKKILILLIISFLLVSCKSSKPACDAYGNIKTEPTVKKIS